MTATPLDAAGRELAPPAFAGPPTKADRAALAVIVPCTLALGPPAGTRQVRLALEGVGQYHTATADAVYLADSRSVPSTQIDIPSSGRPSSPGEGPGCTRWDPTPIGLPVPSPGPKPRCARPQAPRSSARSSAQLGPVYPPPPVPPRARPAPRPPACVSPLRVSRVVLTRTRLSLRLSSPATVRIGLARRRARPGAAEWRRVRNLSLRARRAGRVTRRLRPLRRGTYRITIHARSGAAGSHKRTLRLTLKR